MDFNELKIIIIIILVIVVIVIIVIVIVIVIGGFIVVISVPAFVFALACCCITVNRRGSSKSRAEQQWRQTRSNERLNGNGFVETNSLPTKVCIQVVTNYSIKMINVTINSMHRYNL